MSIEKQIFDRANSSCELCKNSKTLCVYDLLEEDTLNLETSLLICKHCFDQIKNPEILDSNHFQCLNDSMWSEYPAVQIMSYRILKFLAKDEGWARDLLDQLNLSDEYLEIANSEDIEAHNYSK